ncbi:MAG: PDDEXK family nuclease, partial [Acidimicrobiales bacterium]
GFVGAPAASVLESRFMRLLTVAGMPPLATEVRDGPDGCYRVDVKLSGNVYAEVDGYAFHASPEQKRHDERRRNRLRLAGRQLLVYTWLDVVRDGDRVVAEIREAVTRYR